MQLGHKKDGAELVRALLISDLHPDVAAIPDNSLYLLDKRRIGELQRKNEGGILIEGFYVVTGDYEIPEVYDGKNIPVAADDAVFRLKVGLADLNDPEAAEAGAVWSAIAEDNGMTNQQLLTLNPGYDIAVLHAGDQLTISNAVPYLTVVAVERQNYIRDLPYTITYRDDASMYQGDTKVLSKGVYGKADVTANVTIINGEETAREYVASVTLSQPVAEVQARGTKVRPTWFPTGSFRWPCYGVITSYFGPRRASVAGASTYHEALDIANSYGTAIYAADGGTVTLSGWYGGLGYCVKIDHGNGFVTTYGHNSSLLVSVGQHVYKGQQIARMGSTGISSGPHCHFAVTRNGTLVDPLNYLP